MSLSIGTSLAAQTLALENDASSLVLYNGHAGLGANLVGPLSDTSVDGQGFDSRKNVSERCLPEVDDEVLVAFEHGELRRPFVIAPLWDSKSEPPADNVGSTRTGTAANHPHHQEHEGIGVRRAGG